MSHGETWAEARKAVQQDLMRPKSALFYIKELNETTEELCAKVVANLDANSETTDLNATLQRFALEGLGIMFIGTRLGCMNDNPDSLKFISVVDNFIKNILLIIMLPVWMLKVSGIYRQTLNDLTDIYEFCNETIKQAVAKHDKDGSLEGTVLLKMIDKCGRDSQLPTVMALDAFSAGIDTTANTMNWLLYHLATNPDKQERLYKEIVHVIGRDGDMTASNLSKMRYLKVNMLEE